MAACSISVKSQLSVEDRWLLRRRRLLQRYDMSRDEANSWQKKKGMHKKTFEKFIAEYHFIDEMGINKSLNRFEYKRVFALLREGRKTGKYHHILSLDLVKML